MDEIKASDKGIELRVEEVVLLVDLVVELGYVERSLLSTDLRRPRSNIRQNEHVRDEHSEGVSITVNTFDGEDLSLEEGRMPHHWVG